MSLSILVGLALSTLASEDLALIAGGLLARDGRLPLMHAVVACGIGVYIGDLGLWWAGRVWGRRALGLPWLRTRLNPAALSSLSGRIDKRLALAILVSRFVPGSRLPMHVAAGIWGRRPVAFAVWSFVAVMAWTPLLVGSTAYLGDAVVTPLLRGIEASVVSAAATAAVAFAIVKLLGRAAAAAVRYYPQRFDQTTETSS